MEQQAMYYRLAQPSFTISVWLLPSASTFPIPKRQCSGVEDRV